MKHSVKIAIILAGLLLIFQGCSSKQESDTDRTIEAVPSESIKITDRFWLPMIERNRLVTIPYAFKMCEETGRIENFAVAAGTSDKSYKGERYNDTDVFKIIEGASHSLEIHPDSVLEAYVDSVISLIAAAQEPDGYLYTARSADPDHPAPGAGRDRWIDIWVSHELYNAGHLYEAAVAYYKATGKKSLLDVAVKNANLVCNVFGWGRREAAPGHQEIEIGLVKLYEVTGDKKYLDQAKFFLDVRGKPQEHLEHPAGTRFAIYNNEKYLQQQLPILQQTEAVGHAVRATYMYTGMTMLANYIDDKSYLKKSEELWQNVVEKKIYLTGGIGAIGEGESFGDAYYLPNAEAYNETCAAIGNVFWNYSLFKATGDACYINVLERTLYNGLISGISIDGKNFFYPNPLASKGDYTRSPWFGVSCCPGNLTRFFPQVQKFIYASGSERVYINLYVASTVNLELNKTKLAIEQQTNYPWEGKTKVIVTPEKALKFDIMLRIPSWLNKHPFYGDLYSYEDSVDYKPEIKVNGIKTDYSMNKGYAVITRMWKKGDNIEINFPMQVRKVVANHKVQADSGKIALERGPLVYCLEETDNGKFDKVTLTDSTKTSFIFNQELLGGTGTLKIKNNTEDYTAIPYYLWSNRGMGEMEVWINAYKR